MKKKELGRLALLGIAAGVLMTNGPAVEAAEENSIDLEHVLAKPKCKAHGGCGGDLTASRDLNSAATQDDEELDDEDQDEDDEDSKKEEVKKTSKISNSPKELA